MLVIFMGSHLIYFYNNYTSTIDHKIFQYLKLFQKSFNWGDKCCPVILHSLFTFKIVTDKGVFINTLVGGLGKMGGGRKVLSCQKGGPKSFP